MIFFYNKIIFHHLDYVCVCDFNIVTLYFMKNNKNNNINKVGCRSFFFIKNSTHVAE